MRTLPVTEVCSTCGHSLNGNGNCLACLVHIGFDEQTEAETAPAFFGDFEIERREDGSFWELGRGAMGVTYRAIDKVLHRAVALKVIDVPPARDDTKAIRDRFLREARAAAALKHPNVAGVFHFGVASGDRCYCAMELVDGETLEARVRRDGPLEAELALNLSIQIARALTAAASQGLIHRDLKPANIMLTFNPADPEQWEAKVIDFGLAKSTLDGAGERDLTRGGFVGTPTFASPEQLGGAPVDARSDIYSLGVTLWYSLTGEVPYTGKTIEDIRNGQEKLALPIRQLTSLDIPTCLVSLLRRTLAVNAGQRPASSRELLADLESCRAQMAGSNQTTSRWKLALPVTLLAVLLGAAFVYQASRRKAVPLAPLPEKSIAVLPFENLGNDEAKAAFAIGIQDELLSDLARIADLKVISRTSVMKYQGDKQHNVQQIGQTLGVANVLEGSVQQIGNRVRVVAQLIDARTDTHLWGETYDRDLSDVFAIQTEIAQQIALKLRATISPQEQTVIAEKPTGDLTAYAFYAEAAKLNCEAKGFYEKQEQLLQEAIRRDPNFILAHCLLANLYADIYVEKNFASESDRLKEAAKAREVVDTAVRLRPDRGEPHLARAYLYFTLSEFSEARRELDIASRLLPNDVQALFLDARLDRHENRWDDALIKANHAADLDPENAFFVQWTAEAYCLMRRYQEGESFVQRAKSRNPAAARYLDFSLAQLELAKGDLMSARSLSANPTNVLALDVHFSAVFFARDYEAALRLIAEAPAELVEGNFYLKSPDSSGEARVYWAQGDHAKAERAFLALRRQLDSNSEPQARNNWYYQYAGHFDAGLGHKEEAIREARMAVDLNPIARDPIHGTVMVMRLAMVYAWTGDRDRAIEQLEILTKLPSPISYGELRFNPDWDALRGDARFEKLVASLAPKMASR